MDYIKSLFDIRSEIAHGNKFLLNRFCGICLMFPPIKYCLIQCKENITLSDDEKFNLCKAHNCCNILLLKEPQSYYDENNVFQCGICENCLKSVKESSFNNIRFADYAKTYYISADDSYPTKFTNIDIYYKKYLNHNICLIYD